MKQESREKICKPSFDSHTCAGQCKPRIVNSISGPLPHHTSCRAKSNSKGSNVALQELRYRLKIVVVDIDDTLLIGGKASHFFWWLSLRFQRIGRRLQRANSGLIPRLSGYDRVIVLTGRDAKESRFTENQLKRAGVSFNSLLCCPRKQIINEWKTATVRSLGTDDTIVWIDDIFVEGFPESLKSKPHANLDTMAPDAAKATNERSSELEWL